MQDLKWRDIFAEREPRPIDNDKMRQFEQSAEIFPGLDFLVHIRSDNEQKLGARIDRFHRLEGFYRITLFESINFYSSRSKMIKGHRCQGHHCKAVKWRGNPLGLFVRRRKRRNEVDFIGLKSVCDRLSSGEMSV